MERQCCAEADALVEEWKKSIAPWLPSAGMKVQLKVRDIEEW